MQVAFVLAKPLPTIWSTVIIQGTKSFYLPDNYNGTLFVQLDKSLLYNNEFLWLQLFDGMHECKAIHIWCQFEIPNWPIYILNLSRIKS